MKKFSIEIEIVDYNQFTIEAETKEEAIEKLMEHQYRSGSLDAVHDMFDSGDCIKSITEVK